MIGFFRRIRKKLADDNKPMKYMRYAVGEILLVMIGILLALQVNNWNEWRKDRIKEKEVLIQIIETLEMNVEILNGYMSQIDQSNQSNKVILDVIDQKIDYSDALDQHFLASFEQYTESFVSDTGFDGLKSIGLELIQSESLRKEIALLFENTYAIMKERIEAWQIDPFIFKYMDENFVWHETNRATPKDFDSVINDHYYFSILHRLISTHEYMSRMYLYNSKETERVLQLIRDEIGESDVE